ncbi:MAG: hypothetical protein M1834_008186 [Cirrosporium novae-zelandiae]|nr:MAG: hypothetical protein M1834_008186 [Cirrosporium novae-zelandiae]
MYRIFHRVAQTTLSLQLSLGDDMDRCTECNAISDNLIACYSCKRSFCGIGVDGTTCWDEAHRGLRPCQLKWHTNDKHLDDLLRRDQDTIWISADQLQEGPEPNMTNRFTDLMEESPGKSTCIKSLISLDSSDLEMKYTKAPVPGSKSNMAIPTTRDLHLYALPSTFDTYAPIILADCEGIDDRKPTRYEFVESIFTRFLYAFSDIVCYITKEGKTAGRILSQLQSWARYAATEFINQYALPAVIIIVNASTNHNQEWLDQEQAKRSFFDNLDNFNALESYFSAFHVIYVPKLGYETPTIIKGQFEKLNLLMKEGSTKV